MARNKDPKFLELQREWYQKAKDSGFEDIEHLQSDGEMGHLLRGGLRSTSTAKMVRQVLPKSKQYYGVVPSCYERDQLYSTALNAIEEHTEYWRLATHHQWELDEDTPDDFVEGYQLWLDGMNIRAIQRQLSPEKSYWRKKFSAWLKEQEKLFLKKKG